MNLSNLIKEAQRLAGRVDHDFDDRTRRWLNEAQIQWASAVPWPTLVRTETFAASGERTLILPPRVLTIQWVGDRTNKVPLDASQHFDREFPNAYFGGTTGAAYKWREQGLVAVAAQPAATFGQLKVQTGESDVFGVYIAGLAEDSSASGTANQYYFAEEKIDVTGSGVHQSVNTYVRIETLGKDDLTPADVTVKDSGGTNVLARIEAHAYDAQYRQIEFIYVPSSGTQIDICYVQRPAVLIENYQMPPPSVSSEYLIWYAAAMIHNAQAGQEQASAIKRARADEILKQQIYKERLHGDKDLRALPEGGYWQHEDQYEVP